jgi:hypothetical protein
MLLRSEVFFAQNDREKSGKIQKHPDFYTFPDFSL